MPMLMFCVQYPIKSTSGLLSPFLNGRVANTQSETLIEQDSTDASLLTGTITEDPVTKWPLSCLVGKL